MKISVGLAFLLRVESLTLNDLSILEEKTELTGKNQSQFLLYWDRCFEFCQADESWTGLCPTPVKEDGLQGKILSDSSVF